VRCAASFGVEPAEARDLLETLQLELEPFDIVLEGFLLWRYLGGPWAPVDRFPLHDVSETRP